MDSRDDDPAPAAPDIRLALSYVAAGARPALAALFALDERLTAIHVRVREPGLAMLRLAWWRDALEALDETPPPGEPLLRLVAAALIPAVRGEELAGMCEGWMALLEKPAGAETLADYAAGRGGRLFTLAARLLGAPHVPDVARAGKIWALVNIARHLDEPTAATALAVARGLGDTGQGARWPVAVRPLGMLAALAVIDARGIRTTPTGRLLRMLGHRLTGRMGLGAAPDRD